MHFLHFLFKNPLALGSVLFIYPVIFFVWFCIYFSALGPNNNHIHMHFYTFFYFIPSSTLDCLFIYPQSCILSGIQFLYFYASATEWGRHYVFRSVVCLSEIPGSKIFPARVLECLRNLNGNLQMNRLYFGINLNRTEVTVKSNVWQQFVFSSFLVAEASPSALLVLRLTCLLYLSSFPNNARNVLTILNPAREKRNCDIIQSFQDFYISEINARSQKLSNIQRSLQRLVL